MAIVGAAGLCVLASQAAAQFPPITDPNSDEAKCERGAGKALNKFVAAKSKCVVKCIATARKTSGPYDGCYGPAYTDPIVNACIYDSLKGAATKARAAIVKACAADCPECYTSQSADLCSTGDPFVTDTDDQSNTFGPQIWCLENGGTTPDKLQAKCEDGTSKALVKFIAKKAKCYEKCNLNMLKGKIPPDSCTPPEPTDPATNTCLFDPVKGAEAKGAAAIDKVCSGVPGALPPCHTGGRTSGAGWIFVVEAAVDQNIPNIACGP
jgi:hypothetical protein